MSEKAICTRWSMTLAIEPREYGLMPVSEHEAALKVQVDRLQRAAEHEQQLRWKSEADLVAAKSREASPAMLRVVEAAKAWRDYGESRALRSAVDALAAPAVEKPRWTTERRPGWPYNHDAWWANKGSEWVGPMTANVAHAVCKRLNDAEAAR